MSKLKAPKRLSYQKFLESLKLAPRIVIELVIENQSGGGGTLLVKREQVPFVGFWHLPGGFLLKGEYIKDAIPRISKAEVGKIVSNPKFLGYFENPKGDSRRNAHLIHFVFSCKTKFLPLETEKLRYFRNIPPRTISYHEDILKKFLR